MPKFAPFISTLSRFALATACFPTTWYFISDYHTKKHEAARCLFHVCLSGEPDLRHDVVQEYSGSSSCYLHLLYDTVQSLKENELMANDSNFISARDQFLRTLHDSKFYHHYSSGLFFYPLCDESAFVRRLKYHALRMRLMYDFWVKKTPKFIVPLTTVYRVAASSGSVEDYPHDCHNASWSSDNSSATPKDTQLRHQDSSQILGHRSYLVFERDQNQMTLFDTSQLESFPNHEHGPHRRLIAMRFRGLDFDSMETIDKIAHTYTHDVVPMHSQDASHENDNDVQRIVSLLHERLNPHESLDAEPQFVRKGQLYGTCSYYPFEKMISLWFPKEQGKILKRRIRQEVYERYSQELREDGTNDTAMLAEYVLQKAKKASVL